LPLIFLASKSSANPNLSRKLAIGGGKDISIWIRDEDELKAIMDVDEHGTRHESKWIVSIDDLHALDASMLKMIRALTAMSRQRVPQA
jgi:hypothetical protein